MTDLKEAIKILSERVDATPPPPPVPIIMVIIINMDSLVLDFHTLAPDLDNTNIEKVEGNLEPLKRKRGDDVEK